MYLVTLKKPYAMVQRVEESSVRHRIASRKAIKKYSPPQQLVTKKRKRQPQHSVRHGSPPHSPGGGRHPRLLPHLPPLAVHHPGTGVRGLREVSSSSPHVKDWKYLFVYFFRSYYSACAECGRTSFSPRWGGFFIGPCRPPAARAGRGRSIDSLPYDRQRIRDANFELTPRRRKEWFPPNSRTSLLSDLNSFGEHEL